MLSPTICLLKIIPCFSDRLCAASLLVLGKPRTPSFCRSNRCIGDQRGGRAVGSHAAYSAPIQTSLPSLRPRSSLAHHHRDQIPAERRRRRARESAAPLSTILTLGLDAGRIHPEHLVKRHPMEI